MWKTPISYVASTKAGLTFDFWKNNGTSPTVQFLSWISSLRFVKKHKVSHWINWHAVIVWTSKQQTHLLEASRLQKATDAAIGQNIKRQSAEWKEKKNKSQAEMQNQTVFVSASSFRKSIIKCQVSALIKVYLCQCWKNHMWNIWNGRVQK